MYYLIQDGSRARARDREEKYFAERIAIIALLRNLSRIMSSSPYSSPENFRVSCRRSQDIEKSFHEGDHRDKFIFKKDEGFLTLCILSRGDIFRSRGEKSTFGLERGILSVETLREDPSLAQTKSVFLRCGRCVTPSREI